MIEVYDNNLSFLSRINESKDLIKGYYYMAYDDVIIISIMINETIEKYRMFIDSDMIQRVFTRLSMSIVNYTSNNNRVRYFFTSNNQQIKEILYSENLICCEIGVKLLLQEIGYYEKNTKQEGT